MSEETLKKIFSNNLRFYIDENDIKPADIAKVCGVTKTSVSNWVNGKKIPRMDKIQAIANYFGVTKCDLIEKHSVTSGADKNTKENISLTNDPEIHVFYTYKKLDTEDKAEIRGEMKQMLKADKYKEEKKPDPTEHFGIAAKGGAETKNKKKQIKVPFNPKNNPKTP